MRIASLPEERCKKQRNATLPSVLQPKTCRVVGRPKKRWEDEINDFPRLEQTDETKGNDTRNNDTWFKMAKHQKRWKNMESEYTLAAAAASGDRQQARRRLEHHEETPQDAFRPARYVNGVKLGDYETMSIV